MRKSLKQLPSVLRYKMDDAERMIGILAAWIVPLLLLVIYRGILDISNGHLSAGLWKIVTAPINPFLYLFGLPLFAFSQFMFGGTIFWGGIFKLIHFLHLVPQLTRNDFFAPKNMYWQEGSYLAFLIYLHVIVLKRGFFWVYLLLVFILLIGSVALLLLGGGVSIA